MTSIVDVLSEWDAEAFQQFLAASPRRSREEFYRQMGLRRKGGAFQLKSSQSDQERATKAQTAMGNGTPVGDELLEELVRNFLSTRRALLGAGLDFLEVPHDDGLTSQDLDFVRTLETERTQALRKTLLQQFPSGEVELYLSYLGVETSD